MDDGTGTELKPESFGLPLHCEFLTRTLQQLDVKP